MGINDIQPTSMGEVVIPADDQPGDAPESAMGIETGPPGMPLLDPSSTSVAGAVGNAMSHHAMMESTASGLADGGHVGIQVSRMPDPQMPPEFNAMMGNPETTA